MIRTSRCYFELLSTHDFEEIMAMYAEKDSNLYIRPLREKDPQDYPDFLRLKQKQNEAQQGYFWTVRLNDGTFIGTANFNFFELLAIEHCGVHLSRTIWGQGYGTEILGGIRSFAKNKGRQGLNALVEEGNTASRRMLEKAGFKLSDKQIIKGDSLMIYTQTLV